uniref:Uncharacterized protein n=1 Tax=Tanacetum cinerariifolium TaxID=118510 RepID=A0A6L2NQA2_TANCI|nr:hypothetical protein [Tanacetum cinerariifolium]
MEAFDDPGKVFDTLMRLRDDVRVEDAKLIGLNDLIARAEEEIEMKEAQLESIFVIMVSYKYEVCKEILLVIPNGKVSIAKNRRLIAELEALGQRSEALKPLDYMKEIVGRDAATLGVLEQLLAASHAGMRLKASYVAEMEETD